MAPQRVRERDFIDPKSNKQPWKQLFFQKNQAFCCHFATSRPTGKLVGDAGFEPATSTMSTWRSTPELIALSYNYSN